LFFIEPQPHHSRFVSTPDLHLRTCLVLNDEGRITLTREPGAIPGPLFTLVRSAASCVWAVRADVPAELARELDRIARDEPPNSDLRAAPLRAQRYISLLESRVTSGQQPTAKIHQSDGPAFDFPDSLPQATGAVVINDERLLLQHFRGWVAGEIDAGRSPMLAMLENDDPVSICFCARRSDIAAEAGLETAESYRGRGYGPRVTAAWAAAIRRTGLIPLYSTSWTNHASLAVARKLSLFAYASSWSISG
jgi:hypothetical protein